MRLVILDTETAGYASREERVCEVALLEFDGRSWQAHSSLIDPEVPLRADAMAVHHITPPMLEGSVPLSASGIFRRLKELNDEKTMLIAHNAPFDLGVLANYGFSWQGEVIDTLVCAKQLLATPRHALQYLRYALELYRHEERVARELGVAIAPHRAMGDAVVTRLLYEHLLEYVGRLPQALSVISNRPVLLKSIGFGKYRGQAFEKMVEQDPDYFRWCLREFGRLAPEARSTIEYWLARQSR